MNHLPPPPDPYVQAGVKDQQAASLVGWLNDTHRDHHQQPASSSPLATLPPLGTHFPSLSGFASVFSPAFKDLQDPLFVTSTDGVGTKSLLALQHNMLEGIGQDLVAMCANDIFTLGARALGFLDYYATSDLNDAQFQTILKGIHKALSQCACTLVGGETAQMPGLYQTDHFDLAGFIFGVVDRPQMLGPHHVRDQDTLFALPSSGFHANGFSLIRQWLETKPLRPGDLEALLMPTRLYPEIPYLVSQLSTDVVHACAHITGGGLSTNLPRSLPPHATAHIFLPHLPITAWMQDFIQYMSTHPDWHSFENVFNLGVGMILAVDTHRSADFVSALSSINLKAIPIGFVDVHSAEPLQQPNTPSSSARVLFHHHRQTQNT